MPDLTFPLGQRGPGVLMVTPQWRPGHGELAQPSAGSGDRGMGSQFHSESHHTLGTSGTGEPWATPLYEGKPNCEMGRQHVLALSRSHLPSFRGKPRPCGLQIHGGPAHPRGFP